jgi:hypothetical protein
MPVRCYGLIFLIKANNLLSLQIYLKFGIVGSIPLKDPKFKYIPLQVNDMWVSHESMTCGVDNINLEEEAFKMQNRHQYEFEI